MKVVKGDLIEMAKAGEFDMIIHGCNCFCTMGAGIAKVIRKEFPGAYRIDRLSGSGDREKLGQFSFWPIQNPNLIVVNAYTQYDFRGSKNVEYDAIRLAFFRIRKFIESSNSTPYPTKRIGYPKIGAGLAGGDWNIISKIIDEEFEGLDHTLVELP